MPEWLKLLLAANNSLGLADTLQTLTGVTPNYERMPTNRVSASVYPTKQGVALGLSPRTIDNFSKMDTRQGTAFGDFVLGHEFGHIAASGMGNPALGDAFLALDKDAWKSEKFADRFAAAIQFMRSGNRSINELDEPTKDIVKTLLRQEIYKKHPLHDAMPGLLK